MKRSVRAVAYYLPQFHPIPENDAWWGRGFTEWTNTAKAKPLFKEHYQPHIPADLGFYDLRVPETRIAQAEMAKEHGVEAFCYYHYWFAGKELLERPFNEVLESGKPDFPFCLCWANQTWSGVWHGCPDRILIEQTYPGLEDHEVHFKHLIKAFKDKRYLTVEGKPVFVIYNPMGISNVKQVTDFWRTSAKKSGLPGIYLIGGVNFKWDPRQYGFDASTTVNFVRLGKWISWRSPVKRLIREYRVIKKSPTRIFSYEKVMYEIMQAEASVGIETYPTVFPNWDNTPRCGLDGIVLHNSTPELFRLQVRKSLEIVKGFPEERRIIFIKSWNEWAEGNHLEPDLKFGKGYLQVLKDEIAGG